MGLVDRGSIYKIINTGYPSVYTFANTSNGQRQLVMGEHSVGKSTLVSNIFKNIYLTCFKDSYESSIYFNIFIFIGSPRKEFFLHYNDHKNRNKKFNFFVDCTASVLPTLQYTKPFKVFSFVNSLLNSGVNSLVSVDSLDKHAKAFREVMLSFKRAPGREAYPGDIFFLHSNLLERFGQLSFCYNRSGITGLPTTGLVTKSATDYITTNLISITDGQWNLLKSLYMSSKFPSLCFFSSVSRIGFVSLLDILKMLFTYLRYFITQIFNKSSNINYINLDFYLLDLKYNKVYSNFFNFTFYSISSIFSYFISLIFSDNHYICFNFLKTYIVNKVYSDIKFIDMVFNWSLISSYKNLKSGIKLWLLSSNSFK